MNELTLLSVFLGVAFALAPLMTSRFFLNGSKIYSDAHKLALAALLVGAWLSWNYLAAAWPLFCAFGFLLFLKKEYRLLFSVRGIASCIPFLFSLISAAWFFSGMNDLQLLGYNKVWSFYAALHGSFLGWMFVGCLSFLSRKPNSAKIYLWGSYLSLAFFLCVAFGIDGIPYIKRVGVIGLSLAVPLLIGAYAFGLRGGPRRSRYLAALSFGSILLSMALAILNEFWVAAPRVAFGMPIMVIAHGFLNAIVSIPCFYLAIRLEDSEGLAAHSPGGNVIFFDGFCVLCSGTVALLIKLDKNQALKYASLQGKYARETLDSRQIESGASVIFHGEGVSYERAEAALRILAKLGGFCRFLSFLLSLLPLFVLNGAYDFIARNRYRFFGKNDSCLMPRAEDRKLFLP